MDHINTRLAFEWQCVCAFQFKQHVQMGMYSPQTRLNLMISTQYVWQTRVDHRFHNFEPSPMVASIDDYIRQKFKYVKQDVVIW